jgi:hypothetical protein
LPSLPYDLGAGYSLQEESQSLATTSGMNLPINGKNLLFVMLALNAEAE